MENTDPNQDRQYVIATFTKGGRQYTYHNDGPPVKVGDKVNVMSPQGEQVVDVVAVSMDRPNFRTKPIEGIFLPVGGPSEKHKKALEDAKGLKGIEGEHRA